MIGTDDLDRVLQEWFEGDAPGPEPRALLATVIDTTRRRRPRPEWFVRARGGGIAARPVRMPSTWSRLRPLWLALLLGLLLALATAAAVLIGGQPSPQPPVVSNGWIAFAANQPGNPPNVETADVYLTGDGIAPRRIIGSDGDGVAQRCVEFSPDGSMLAYGEGASSPGPDPRGPGPMDGRGVVVVELGPDGEPSPPTQRIALPTGFGLLPCPEWSPRGTQVAFFADSEAWVADVVSGEVATIPVHAWESSAQTWWKDQDLEWSPDGSSIAVTEPGQVRSIPIDGAEPTVLPIEGAEALSLAWTPDGRRIVYLSSANQIRMLELDGGGDQLLQAEAGENFESGNVVVSPDGARLAYVRLTTRCDDNGCDSSGPDLVVVLDIDGANEIVLPTPGSWGPGSGLLWSPDGRRLLYRSWGDDGDAFVSVAVTEGSPAAIHPTPASTEWMTISDVSWQPVIGAPVGK